MNFLKSALNRLRLTTPWCVDARIMLHNRTLCIDFYAEITFVFFSIFLFFNLFNIFRYTYICTFWTKNKNLLCTKEKNQVWCWSFIVFSAMFNVSFCLWCECTTLIIRLSLRRQIYLWWKQFTTWGSFH